MSSYPRLFNPIPLEDIPVSKPTCCPRFTPRNEKSVYCRTCDQMWYAHPQDAKRFQGADALKQMHKAYMTNKEVIRWLVTLGDTIDLQLDAVRGILERKVEVDGAPDLIALQSIESILNQLKIEMVIEEKQKAKKPTHCDECGEPLELTEEATCVECSSKVIDISNFMPVSDDKEGTPATLFPEHDFD